MKLRGAIQAVVAASLLLALTACGPGEPSLMPDVVGQRLDIAKSDIERAGFASDVEIIGGGLFGVIDDRNWMVCEQDPAPGESISNPRLIVERECGSDGEKPAEPSESAEPSEPVDPASVTETTVDELLDRLNSVDMGGIQVGELFHFTGELIPSDLWFTGATGDFVVSFTAHGGADDLIVLLDKSDTRGWTGGTRLDVIVENVELTVNGETSDGWLRVVSAIPVG